MTQHEVRRVSPAPDTESLRSEKHRAYVNPKDPVLLLLPSTTPVEVATTMDGGRVCTCEVAPHAAVVYGS